AVRRQVDAAGAVEQHAAIDHDAPGPGPHQPGDGIEHRGLARAGAARQRDHARAVLDADVALEVAALELDIERQHAWAPAGSARPRQAAPATVARQARVAHWPVMARGPRRGRRAGVAPATRRRAGPAARSPPPPAPAAR